MQVGQNEHKIPPYFMCRPLENTAHSGSYLGWPDWKYLIRICSSRWCLLHDSCDEKGAMGANNAKYLNQGSFFVCRLGGYSEKWSTGTCRSLGRLRVIDCFSGYYKGSIHRKGYCTTTVANLQLR